MELNYRIDTANKYFKAATLEGILKQALGLVATMRADNGLTRKNLDLLGECLRQASYWYFDAVGLPKDDGEQEQRQDRTPESQEKAREMLEIIEQTDREQEPIPWSEYISMHPEWLQARSSKF